jgi:pullulanase/glycogen debranching enzyme
MLLGGDELGRTQDGNNNAYCQDNEISWYDWDNVDEGLLEFTRRLIRLAPGPSGVPAPALVRGSSHPGGRRSRLVPA